MSRWTNGQRLHKELSSYITSLCLYRQESTFTSSENLHIECNQANKTVLKSMEFFTMGRLNLLGQITKMFCHVSTRSYVACKRERFPLIYFTAVTEHTAGENHRPMASISHDTWSLRCLCERTGSMIRLDLQAAASSTDLKRWRRRAFSTKRIRVRSLAYLSQLSWPQNIWVVRSLRFV